MKIKALILGAVALFMSSLALADGHVNLDGPGSLPPNAEPGQCFVHKFYPPEYIPMDQQIMIKEGYKYFTTTPPVLGTDTLVYVFNTPDLYQAIDPVFGMEEITIMIKPDDPVWHVKCCKHKKRCGHGKCPYPKADHNHDYEVGDTLSSGYHDKDKCGSCGHKKNKPCEQACFKAVRPVYKVIEKQTTIEDGKVETILTQDRIFEFEIPIIAEEATYTEHVVEPEFMTVTTYTLDHPGYMKWVEGTCKKYTCNPRDLQSALKDKGYYKGPVDGIVGQGTITAMNDFRRDNGLGIHDEIDKETAKALGL